jgi:hypothetical protein
VVFVDLGSLLPRWSAQCTTLNLYVVSNRILILVELKLKGITGRARHVSDATAIPKPLQRTKMASLTRLKIYWNV